MGKKKNKNKVSGAVKTATKTEKKLANKLKKELANLGEDDIAKIIAEIEKEEAKRSQATEKALQEPPSARAYATLTPHPINNELILFGGEFHDGKKTVMYNDLLFYNPVNNTWKQVKAPGGPAPRSAHQAVTTSANKGELWIFGGEFTSPSETQFYHYRDLWCFSLSDKKWEKVVAPNGPSSRSGHRMALLGRKLVVFGGYHDDGRECRYFDDVYEFCLDNRAWTKLQTSGKGPAPRSACVMMPHGNDSLIIHGGFSRVREGRSERSFTHTDSFRLARRKDGGWAWRSLGTGAARAGQAAACNAHSGRGYVFGGSRDVEETEEELRGDMLNELHMVDLESGKWNWVTVGQRTANTGQTNANIDQSGGGDTEVKENEDLSVTTDEVYTLKIGSQPTVVPSTSVTPLSAPSGDAVGPCPRMSAMLAVQRSVLFLFGGVVEKGDKQYYLEDMYSLDLHKLNEWQLLHGGEPDVSQADSETETESGSGTDSSEDEESDQ